LEINKENLKITIINLKDEMKEFNKYFN